MNEEASPVFTTSPATSLGARTSLIGQRDRGQSSATSGSAGSAAAWETNGSSGKGEKEKGSTIKGVLGSFLGGMSGTCSHL